MFVPAVYLPTLLGLVLLVVGIFTWRRNLGPAFVAAALAAFAGEHFTAAATLAKLVPKFLPARLFIAYFVGVAHLAAASSFAAKRYVRWSAPMLALMFALFVLLMDLPGALRHPGVRIDWSLAARETTFAIGALALFAVVARDRRPDLSRAIATVARLWAAAVLVFYGIENILFPQYSPGVPDLVPTASWVPMPTAVAYLTGLVLIACGVAMFVERFAGAAAAACGWFMVLLTLTLYVPQFFLASDVAQYVTAINFIFDTLLFAGMMLVIRMAIRLNAQRPAPPEVSSGPR